MNLKFVKNHFCGVTLDDTSQCNDNKVCSSGSNSDSDFDSGCNLGQSFYGFKVCRDHFCGISLDDTS